MAAPLHLEESRLLALPQHLLACIFHKINSAQDLISVSLCSLYTHNSVINNDDAYRHLIVHELGFATADANEIDLVPCRTWRGVYLLRLAIALGHRLDALDQDVKAAQHLLAHEELTQRQRTVRVDVMKAQGTLQQHRQAGLGDQAAMWVRFRSQLRLLMDACGKPSALGAALDDAWESIRRGQQEVNAWHVGMDCRLEAAEEYAMRVQAVKCTSIGHTLRVSSGLLARADLIHSVALDARQQADAFAAMLGGRQSETATSVRKLYLQLAACRSTLVPGPKAGAAARRAFSDLMSKFKAGVTQRLSQMAGTTDKLLDAQAAAKEAAAAVHEDLRLERTEAGRLDVRVRALEATLATCDAAIARCTEQRRLLLEYAPWVRAHLAAVVPVETTAAGAVDVAQFVVLENEND